MRARSGTSRHAATLCSRLGLCREIHLPDPLTTSWVVVVDIVLRTPRSEELRSLAATVGAWQRDGGPIHLHPGDLGWYSMRGPQATARALRVWSRDGVPVAVGLLDGPDGLLRLAIDPDERSNEPLARQLCRYITDPACGVLPSGEAIV